METQEIHVIDYSLPPQPINPAMKDVDYWDFRAMTPEQRNALYGSAPDISDDIVEELITQTKGYLHYTRGGLEESRKLAIQCLKDYGSDRVYLIPVTQEMEAVGDYGFRLKE